ncbi:MAG TPA: hypothetical protein VIM65_05575, partial [Cyclobacteriaceae bacterium]
MKSFITKIYILTFGIISLCCVSKQKPVDPGYKQNCLIQLDDAVDNCKECSVDSMERCFKKYLDLDTIKDIDIKIWREYAYAKGLYHHSVFAKSKELVNQLIGVTEGPSQLIEHAKV